MLEFKDYYKTLGLNKNASLADIKSAFKKLAKKYHPDTSEGSEEKFKEINEAYEVLKDTSKRNKYDSMHRYQSSVNNPFSETHKRRSKESPLGDFEDLINRSQQRSQGTSNDSSFSDFFEMLFGHYQKQAETSRPPSGKQNGEDYEMDLELSLEEAHCGTMRKIEISGANKSMRRLEVNIPANVNEGNKIKISGEGKASKNGGKNGDLFLKIKIKKHDKWRIEDKYDIHENLVLEPQEAVLGGSKTIITLAGKMDLSIPPKTRNSQKLRLKGKGLKNPKTQTCGDHYVHIIIDIPSNLNEEEKKLYEKIAKSRKTS